MTGCGSRPAAGCGWRMRGRSRRPGSTTCRSAASPTPRGRSTWASTTAARAEHQRREYQRWRSARGPRPARHRFTYQATTLRITRDHVRHLRIADDHDHDRFVAICDTLCYAKALGVVAWYAKAGPGLVRAVR